MRVLILSITAGEGHNATARGLQIQFEKMGHTCEVVDTYRNIDKSLYALMSRGYLLSVTKLKRLYERTYYRLEHRKKKENEKGPIRIANMVIAGKIRKKIAEYAPDVILYTHVFCGLLLDVLRQKDKLNIPTIGVVTDYVVHPYWEENLRTDSLVVPNEILAPSAVRKGFRPDQVQPLGIPVDPKFGILRDKREARAKLGLDVDTKTVLLMGGSMGYGNIAQTIQEIDALDLKLQMICVCGNNTAAREEIDRLATKKRILNFGYVHNVDELMDASDCIVTKPGGLTTSEALCKCLPMIVCNPIPGHETRNTEFLMNHGIAMAVSEVYSLADALHQFFSNEVRAELMQKNIHMLRKPNATEEICRLAERTVGI